MGYALAPGAVDERAVAAARAVDERTVATARAVDERTVAATRAVDERAVATPRAVDRCARRTRRTQPTVQLLAQAHDALGRVLQVGQRPLLIDTGPGPPHDRVGEAPHGEAAPHREHGDAAARLARAQEARTEPTFGQHDLQPAGHLAGLRSGAVETGRDAPGLERLGEPN